MGEANKRTLELIQNWCAHLAINKLGGGGMVEQFTSLPIGPRSLSCQHAAAPGFAGSDLKFLAVDFYDRNCVGCAHRQALGFPNLSSLIHDRDKVRAASAAVAARRDAAAAAARKERDAKRQAIRANLTPPGANVIDQIEELDHDRDGADANRLLETAKLAPEVFTAPVVENAFELLEAGEYWFDRAGLRLLKELNADKVRLTRCALLCLPRLFAAEPASEVLIENARARGQIVGWGCCASPYLDGEPATITSVRSRSATSSDAPDQVARGLSRSRRNRDFHTPRRYRPLRRKPGGARDHGSRGLRQDVARTLR